MVEMQNVRVVAQIVGTGTYQVQKRIGITNDVQLDDQQITQGIVIIKIVNHEVKAKEVLDRNIKPLLQDLNYDPTMEQIDETQDKEAKLHRNAQEDYVVDGTTHHFQIYLVPAIKEQNISKVLNNLLQAKDKRDQIEIAINNSIEVD